MTDGLRELGWDERWAARFAPHAAAGLIPARVTIEFNHLYQAIGPDGEIRLQHAGRFKHRATERSALAAVGDWVAVRLTAGEAAGTIEAVLPRRSRFSRKVAGELTEEQVVAANIDTVFLVMGLDGDYNPRRLERYLLLAHESGARPVVLLSKADLATDLDAALTEIATMAAGVPVYAISAVAGRGLDDVLAHLGPGRTGALLGSSGAGKSTLVNALVGTELLPTQAVRESDSRGRHTTRHRQLITLPGRGLLIDTPGMRELQLWDITEATRETFDDIEALAASCHFSNCQHRDEPRCAVKAAVADGTIAAERLASYVKLQQELADLDARKDARAIIDEKRRSKIQGKALKAFQKHRGR
ncbi:MAG: ribosome small subunit-dependent GTPase A [Acidobacteria bacterium]|nr:ribosome small subunit-dependent GTPase A [Acidobacteriota bacterium]